MTSFIAFNSSGMNGEPDLILVMVKVFKTRFW